MLLRICTIQASQFYPTLLIMIMKKMTILLTLPPLAEVEVGDVEEDEDVAEVGAELRYQEYVERDPTFLRILKCCQCLQFKSC